MTLSERSTSIGRDWRMGLVFAAILVPLALLETAHRFTASVAISEPVPWERVLARDLIIWLTYFPLVPTVLLLARHARLDNPAHRLRNGLLHLGAAMAFAYLHLAAVSLFTSQSGLVWPTLRGVPGLPIPPDVTFVDEFVHYVRNNFTLSFVAYWLVAGVFYATHYYVESKEREVRAAQLETSLAAARLDALRSQLNPHFLFNTLNAISVLAMKGRQSDVVDMLERLSDLLRFSLDDTRPQEIPLARELEFLEGYLDIQEVRFADRLNVRRRIAEETLPAAVPAMILQPLIENAIKHGVSRQCGVAHIDIEASRDNGTLRLRVSDSGRGFQVGGERRGSKGIGLANTEARLEQLYGAAQRIEYGEGVQGGAAVTISIPFRRVADSSGIPEGLRS